MKNTEAAVINSARILTPLRLAAEANDTQKMRELIQAGEGVNEYNAEGETALMPIAENPKLLDALRVIIDAGADVNARRNVPRGISVLAYAVHGDNAAGAKILIDAGAKIKGISLFSAVNCGATGVVRVMIEAGANPSERSYGDDEYYKTFIDNDYLLMAAAERGHLETMKDLIDAGADVNSTCSGELTALGRVACADPYRDYDGDEENGSGYTPDDAATAELLIAAGADVNATNATGTTPLMCAAISGNTKVLKVLVAYGAAVDAKDDHSRDAISHAEEAEHADIVDFLRAAQASQTIEAARKVARP